MSKYIFSSHSPSATLNLGRKIGERLKAGSIIALIGELGCGKTLFTRGLCTGLVVPLRQVNSPTFIFVNEYQGRLPVFHMDLYRLGGEAEGFEIGLLDYIARARSGVMVVEWAEKVLTLLPDDRLQVEFQVVSARKRQIVFSSIGERFSDLLKELGES
ncbi:MAG: tRNA (adenosine(37)-N6)-threonylcarbamoyltransferase complex ATPase subunit type 1 TsaE [Chloroflexi bacterium RBG_16_50_9]|nr:MAG: tRNA (adenosine(37)-N6)-threonylcarbamoyltransferase complex ATPase subunit type 1 TsaE [Chloroflexi bacterium RBG_16_50_9]